MHFHEELTFDSRSTPTSFSRVVARPDYRAMHFSAKHGNGIAIAYCPSICNVGELWSLKIISPLVSLVRSLFATPTWRVCSKGNTPKFGPKVTHPPVDLSVGDIRLQIAAKWLHIAQWSQWRAYRKSPSLFRMVPSLTPYGLPFPQNGGSICPQDICEWPYLRNGWSDTLHVWFYGRVFRVGRSNGIISGYIKSKLAAGRCRG